MRLSSCCALVAGGLIGLTSPSFAQIAPSKDCIREKSVTQRGSMTNPEWIFRFSSVKPATEKPVNKAMPDLQQKFLSLVDEFAAKFKNAPNNTAKDALRAQRAEEICALLKRPFMVEDWRGTVAKLWITKQGVGILEVDLNKTSSAKTWNNPLSDKDDETLINPGTPLHDAVMQLSRKQEVIFSGQFVPGDTTQKGPEGTATNATAPAPNPSQAPPQVGSEKSAESAKRVTESEKKPVFESEKKGLPPKIKIRTQTIACDDIGTALNTPVAERTAKEWERWVSRGGAGAEPQCFPVGGRQLGEYTTWDTHTVPGAVIPPLPPGKVAFCVSSITSTTHECSWVIVSQQDVCEVDFFRDDLNRQCWAKW